LQRPAVLTEANRPHPIRSFLIGSAPRTAIFRTSVQKNLHGGGYDTAHAIPTLFDAVDNPFSLFTRIGARRQRMHKNP
jgi:hypothetical protein